MWIFYVTVAFAGLAILYLNTFSKLKDENDKITFSGKFFIFLGLLLLLGNLWSIYNNFDEAKLESKRINKILDTISLESQRLHPSDFSFRISTQRHTKGKFDKINANLEMTVSCNIDSAFCLFELFRIPYSKTEALPRVSSLRHNYKYYSKNLALGNFENYRFIEDLNHKKIEILVPKDYLEFSTGVWKHYIDTYIRGRHFKGDYKYVKLYNNSFVKITVPIELD